MGPPSFRCLGLCSPPSKPDSTGLGALLPAPCLLSVPHPVQRGHHACSGPRDGIEPKSGRLEGANGHFFSFFSVQSLSRVQLFVTPGTAACQASLSFTNSWSLLKLMSIESVMPSNHLILCCPLLLLPSIFPSISVFSNESVLHIRWPKYWSFRFIISPSNEYSVLISF